MLLELNIADFAIIDRLRLSFCAHLNVFTGETGAGKSIIVDAISALVGERMGADVVRTGADRAIVEGIFDVATLTTADAAKPTTTEGEDATDGEALTLGGALAELGIEPEDDGALILSREILRGGLGIAR
ncbi:MAG: AAA family ATPase, partial [Ktedonobacterales bacterium]